MIARLFTRLRSRNSLLTIGVLVLARRRPVRDRRPRLGAGPSDRRSHARRVRRRARAPRRDPAAPIGRAVVADAVGRAADPQARDQRLEGQGRRRRRAVRRHDAAADDSGEAVRAEAGQRRDRAGERAGADRQRTERDRADEGELRHRAREARHQQGRHRLADRERAGEAGARRRASSGSRSSRRRCAPTDRRRGRPVEQAAQAREGALRSEARGGRPREVCSSRRRPTASSTCCRTTVPAA